MFCELIVFSIFRCKYYKNIDHCHFNLFLADRNVDLLHNTKSKTNGFCDLIKKTLSIHANSFQNSMCDVILSIFIGYDLTSWLTKNKKELCMPFSFSKLLQIAFLAVAQK